MPISAAGPRRHASRRGAWRGDRGSVMLRRRIGCNKPGMTEPLDRGRAARIPSAVRPAAAGRRGAPRGRRAGRRRRSAPLRALGRLFGGAGRRLRCWPSAWPRWAAMSPIERFTAGLPDVDGPAPLPAAGDEPGLCRRFAAAVRTGHRAAHLRALRRHSRHREAAPSSSAEDQNFFTHRGVDPVAIAARRGDRPDAITARAGGRSAPPPSPSRWPRTCCWAATRCRWRARRARRSWRMRHRGDAQQGAHPRTVPERDLSRPAGLRRGGGGAGLFQQVARRADARRGGVPGGAAEGAEQLQSVPLPRRGARRGATGCSTAWRRTTSSPPSRRPRPRRSRSRRRSTAGPTWWPAPTISPRRCAASWSSSSAPSRPPRAGWWCAPRSTRRCRRPPTARCATG